MDIARPKADGTDRMDWDNKITMKLNSRDIAQIVMGVRTTKTVDIFHKVDRPDGTSPSTSLKVEPGEKDTFKWFVGKTDGEDKKYVTIFLDKYDMYLAFQLLESAIPVVHGWVH